MAGRERRQGDVEPPSSELFEAIAEFTYDWESWIDECGVLRWLNPAVERLTGYSPAECLAQDNYPLDLVHEDDRPMIEETMRQATCGESGNHVEFRILRKDRSLRWGAISWQPLWGEGRTRMGFRTSVRDIHRRKQAEAELREAVRKAEQANRDKTQFLANVTHELRTPLQSILGYAQLLKRAEMPTLLDGYATILQEQSEHLGSLVDELLDFSSLQAGVLPVRNERYVLKELVERVCRALLPLARKKELRLTWNVEAESVLCGDPQRISQVLSNLVGNSIKFTTQGQVRVTARVLEPSLELELVVDDTGPGLPDAKVLFEAFRQGHDVGEQHDGVGLGLAISSQLCQRMGGSLSPDQNPSGGGRMIARLPGRTGRVSAHIAHYDGGPRASVPPTQLSDSRPLSILILDDVKHAREFMRDALASLGYTACLADSAERGYALAEATTPDVILIDIQMPGVDGWQAAQVLRRTQGPEPYLVALTAQRWADDPEKLASAGFDGYAQKPLRFRELQALLVEAYQVTHQRCMDLFSQERVAELQSVKTTTGETLFEQTRRHTLEALPKIVSRLKEGEQALPQELLSVVHDAAGVFATIGATAPLSVAERCEDALRAKRACAEDVQLLARLSRRSQAVLSRPVAWR